MKLYNVHRYVHRHDLILPDTSVDIEIYLMGVYSSAKEAIDKIEEWLGEQRANSNFTLYESFNTHGRFAYSYDVNFEAYEAGDNYMVPGFVEYGYIYLIEMELDSLEDCFIGGGMAYKEEFSNET